MPTVTLPDPPAYLAKFMAENPSLMEINQIALSSTIPRAVASTLKESASGQIISISKIRNAMDNKPVPFSTTWGAFVDSFRVPVVRGRLSFAEYIALDPQKPAEKVIRDQQKDGAAIIAGPYSRSDTRKQDNLLALDILTLDIDESTYSFDELCDLLEGFEAVVHTSYSHSLGKPKYRVFILLQQPITTDIKQTLGRIIDFFDDRIEHIDPACRKPGQLFYTPACPPGGEGLYQFRHLSGVPLDPADFPVTPSKDQAPALQKSQITNLKTIQSALSFIDPDSYEIWLKVGMALKNDFGEEGQDLWLQWGSTSEKFDDAGARCKWETFDIRESGDKITCGTIIKMAKDNGWIPAVIEPDDNSDPMTAAVTRLAKLPPLQYDTVRKDESKALGVRPGTLDDAVKSARKGESKNDLLFTEVEPWSEPVEPAQLLTDIATTIRRFIVCCPEVSYAVALWVAMTWFIDVVQVAPLAVITAPEKRCGKTQLLTILARLAARAITASSISPAALFRTIEACCPTLFIDEADAFMKDNEEMRGLLNSGHTRDSAYVIRTVGEDFTPTKFSTWGAKALAGIGHLADTLMDRSVNLELRRKLPHEKVDRIRYAEPSLFDDLRSKLARFADDCSERVRLARPDLPVSLNDRAQDNWEPLLAIAMVAGGDWFKIGTVAALKLSGGESLSLSIGTELLADIQEIFEHRKIDKISTAELILTLCADDEKPWATYNRGNQIKPRQIATKLKGYGIHSKTIRVGSGITPKGYDLNQFKDVFSRYLSPPVSATTPQVSIDGGLCVADSGIIPPQVEPKRNTDTPCGGYKNTVADEKILSATLKTAVVAGCGVVADRNPSTEGAI